VATGSSQTSGGPESKASVLRPASTIARVLGRAAHHRRRHEEARLEGLGRGAVAVEVAAIISVHEDVGAALQFGIDAARRFWRSTTSLVTSTSRTPPWTIASASLIFCTHTPAAPSATCFNAMTGHL
jgi:hypothetical protein